MRGVSCCAGLLQSTGVAGRPESYFRQPDERSWAAQWGIIGRADGRYSYGDYLAAALNCGRTDNGLFGARIMWGTMGYLARNLAQLYPDVGGADAALLHQAFGRTRFVYLHRGDTLAQAVSWLRAEQTNVWFETPLGEPGRPEHEPRFDRDQIGDLIQTIAEHNAAWQEWFASAGVRPLSLAYEELDGDAVGTTRAVLDFLGLEPPPGLEIVPQHRRLADSLNEQWADRYRRGQPS